MIITLQAAVALNQSIVKWTKCAKGNRIAKGVSDCALCQLYHPCVGTVANDNCEVDCDSCPIAIYTGESCCYDTPYQAYVHASPNNDAKDPQTVAAAKAMLAFLKKVRKASNVKAKDVGVGS